MRFVIEKAAEPGTLFGADCFASQIGRLIPVEVAPGIYQQSTIRSAEVIEGGAKARLQVEAPDSDEIRALFDPGLSRYGIGTRP